MPAIRCPRCKKLNTELFDGKRKRERGYVRMRICNDCGFKFSTVEEYSKQTIERLRKEGKLDG